MAVAAALRVSRTMEPRIGGKRKGESFLVLGKRKTYEGEMEQSDVHSHHNTKYYSDAHSRNGGSSSSTASSSSSCSERSYAELSKQNLSAAEIKLERMQKLAQEKAEKVRKVVEEKASKIRKQAEEKANKLRCLADEKVTIIFDIGCPVCQSHHKLLGTYSSKNDFLFRQHRLIGYAKQKMRKLRS